MQLSNNLRKRLVSEFEYSINMMINEQDYFRKLFFFSALHADINRVMNISWDDELALTHGVLQYTHQQILSRVETTLSGRDKTVRIPELLFLRLVEASDLLRQYIENDNNCESIIDILERFNKLAYLTTGNGYFLYEKGILKI